MKRAITGYHKDEAADWVAKLECGHTQHVRHNPPWQLRPWVTSIEGTTANTGRQKTFPYVFIYTLFLRQTYSGLKQAFYYGIISAR